MFIPEELQRYAARLGKAEFAARMAAEQGMRECRGARQGKGLFCLENKIDLYGLITVSYTHLTLPTNREV